MFSYFYSSINNTIFTFANLSITETKKNLNRYIIRIRKKLVVQTNFWVVGTHYFYFCFQKSKMLQQILRDLWVDPEILAELDEGQKQTLFCKMREEQVRRWMMWDQKVSQTETIRSQKKVKPKKTVNFLMGVNGEPWVWVMGEHADDKSVEEILVDEAREKARKLVEENLASPEIIQMNEKNISNEIPIKQDSVIDDSLDLDIYCSVEELKERAKLKPLKNINNFSFNHYKNGSIFNSVNDAGRDVLQEISLNKVQKVAQKVALWEKKMMEERIFKTIHKKHLEAAKEAEEAEHNQEEMWKEQGICCV